jgi:hypothetical protein
MHGDERVGWFYTVIEKYVTAAIACVVDVAGMRKIVRETSWPHGLDVSGLDNPYYPAFKGIIAMLARRQHSLNITKPIDFIFDRGHDEEAAIRAWHQMTAEVDDDTRKVIGARPPIFRDDKTTLPLQAADLLANWVRRWEHETPAQDGVTRTLPWIGTREIDFMGTSAREEWFREEAQRIIAKFRVRKDEFQR